jgi:tetratricopeptide (TPR) repeat protein
MVDADLPAAYRLPEIAPPVALPLAPPAVREERIASLPEAVVEPPSDAWPKEPVVEQVEQVVEQPAEQVVTPASAETIAYAPSETELTTQLLPAVQRGYKLAQRGALFAARTEFVQVLRRVAQCKDASTNTDVHSQALADGLRALDEADDFVPEGIQVEAELDVALAASSHRTPVLQHAPTKVLPHEAAAMYHAFAKDQLAKAASGEQAGSMALYGLGKVYSRQAECRDNEVEFVRGAMTMYSAALAACPDNHLAENELGVLLCRTGHAADAARHFERAIDFAPSATTYHNLAVAQQKLGMAGQAAANELESQRLASWDRSQGAVSRRAGVQWVSPAEMASVAQPSPFEPATPSPPQAPHAVGAPARTALKSIFPWR